MNILQLCKAAERYEMLCMMNLSKNEIRKAAGRYNITFEVLHSFIDSGANDAEYRGRTFAEYVDEKLPLVKAVLLNSDFYEIWEHAVNS